MKRFVIPTPCTLVLADDGTLSIELTPVAADPAAPHHPRLFASEDAMLQRLNSLFDIDGRLAFTVAPRGKYQFADAGPLARWLRTGEWPS